MPRMPAHQVTTRNLGAAYPFIAEVGLGQRGVLIGDDLLGGSFVFDPFELYAQGAVSDPNMVVFGQIGRQKRLRQDVPLAPSGLRAPGLGRRPEG